MFLPEAVVQDLKLESEAEARSVAHKFATLCTKIHRFRESRPPNPD